MKITDVDNLLKQKLTKWYIGVESPVNAGVPDIHYHC